MLACLAAGGGKSTSGALAAALCDGVAVVLSPSARLAREQQARLEHRRLPCVRLDPNASEAEQSKICSELAKDSSLLLLSTPGALAGAPRVREALRKRGVTLCVLEEAQALAEASDAVCPSLAVWRRLLTELGRPRVLALLSPSTFAVRRQVQEYLELSEPAVIEGGPIRDNVILEFHRLTGDARKRAFSGLLQSLRRPGLVLAQTPREVEEVYGLLAAARIPAHRYHAELSPAERLGEQLNFMLPGRKTVMVAQSAFAPSTGVAGIDDERLLDGAPRGFGLGLDKRDLRFLVHWGAPATVEQLVREVGAVGRDGDEARAIVYCDEGDSNRNGALLMRYRLHPPHASNVADALDGQALESRRTTVEALALETGLSLSTLESWGAVFEAAGVLRVHAGWVEALVSMRDVAECATEVASRLWRLQREDSRRLSAMRDVMLDSGCPRAAVERALGSRSTPCGRCANCRRGLPAAPVRRPAAQTFSITHADAEPERAPALSAKVSELAFGRS